MKFILMVLLGGSFLIFAQAPRFNGPTFIYDGGVQIDVDYYGSPYVYDWNGDGKKDLILGQFTSGYIRFYSNIGSDLNPQFSGFEYLSASGSQITLPYG
jgi:hypothetical protein